MILLCNGDSWTQGDSPAQKYNWEATKTLDWYDIIPNFGNNFGICEDRIRYKFYDSDVWPKVLGRKLGFETWNAGRLGDSNDRILRTTISSVDYLDSIGKTDLFVVIGLTSMFRYENWNNQFENKFNEKEQPGKYINERIGPEEWLEFGEESLIHRTCLNIIHLQNFLKERNIPYLIFNCFDDMDEDIRKDSLFKYIDLNNIYNRDFEAHFKNFIVQKYNTNWINNDDYFKINHPTDKSHIAWGIHLHKYIKENYELY